MKKLQLFFVIISSSLFSQAKIVGIEAKLFYNENNSNEENVIGKFSDNIIDSDFALWNVIIGEGSAEGYSNQTIVLVEVSSKVGNTKNQQVKLTATKGKSIILQQTKTFSPVNDNTKIKILFLLDDTGCDAISLKADIIENKKIVSTFSKKIDFDCGE